MKSKKMSHKPDCEIFSDANFHTVIEDCGFPVLAVFEADWSGTCHIMTPILQDLCVEFKGRVKIGIIDVDTNRKLVRDYGIEQIPSLLFFNDGKIVDHINGSVPKHVIAARLSELIPPKKSNKGAI